MTEALLNKLLRAHARTAVGQLLSSKTEAQGDELSALAAELLALARMEDGEAKRRAWDEIQPRLPRTGCCC